MAAARKPRPDFEAKDKAADKKAGVKEGSARDERMDKAGMRKGGADYRGVKNGKRT